MLNPVRVVAIVVLAFAASRCGGTPTAPSAPGSPATPPSIPVLRAIGLSRTNIDAGEEITATANLEGTDAPGRLQYVWSVEPNAGTLSPSGSTARWRAPADDPVPATYFLRVTLVETSASGLATTAATTSSQAVPATSPPITVNDARREMLSHGEDFLREAMDRSVPPETSVRNFTDSCTGKQQALDDIATNRTTYSSATMKYDLQLFVRSIEWPNCTAPDGSARCVLLIYDAQGTRTRTADGVQEPVQGTEYLQGYYERNRWWLCGARFEAQ